MICGIHKKEMRQNAKGWYCPTPITKSSDGAKVLEWCQWKPGQDAAKPEYTEKMANTSDEIREKLNPDRDFVAEARGKIMTNFIAALIQYRGLFKLTPDEEDILIKLVDFNMRSAHETPK